MDPWRRLKFRSICSRDRISLSSLGMVPVRMPSSRIRLLRLWRRLNSCGRVPATPFCSDGVLPRDTERKGQKEKTKNKNRVSRLEIVPTVLFQKVCFAFVCFSLGCNNIPISIRTMNCSSLQPKPPQLHSFPPVNHALVPDSYPATWRSHEALASAIVCSDSSTSIEEGGAEHCVHRSPRVLK